MSIKAKVLLLSILGPALLAITIFTYAVQSIWSSEEELFIRPKGLSAWPNLPAMKWP